MKKYLVYFYTLNVVEKLETTTTNMEPALYNKCSMDYSLETIKLKSLSDSAVVTPLTYVSYLNSGT